MLKKDNFVWKEDSTTIFQTSKQALIITLVLGILNFSKNFMVETDASAKGIEAILMQDKHPIVYISKALGPTHQAMFHLWKRIVGHCICSSKIGELSIAKTFHYQN